MESFSVVIPAYNEESRIEKTLRSYISVFDAAGVDYEILVVPNGCADNTTGVIRKVMPNCTQLKIIEILEPVGKGGAVIEGMKQASKSVIGFSDADGSTSADQILKMVQNIDSYDGIIASRWLKESRVIIKQPLSRRVVSRIFNILVRIILGLSFADTQCGAKFFRKDIFDVLKQVSEKGFAFDVEILYRCKLAGKKIREFPVVWNDSPDSRIRVAQAGSRMLLSLFRIRKLKSDYK